MTNYNPSATAQAPQDAAPDVLRPKPTRRCVSITASNWAARAAQSSAPSTAKLGVEFFHYFRDRLVCPDTTPSLAERSSIRIEAR